MADQTDQDRITEYLRRYSTLVNERSSWLTHWQELSEFILPRSGRFLVTDVNDGRKLHNSIYNSTATRALRVLVAGLVSGMTSPARPWFRLLPSDYDLLENKNVRDWLERVQDVLLLIFSKSNAYRALPAMYGELGVFGTAAAIVEPSFENVIHLHTMTAGEYCIALDDEGRANALYREFQMTAVQVVDKFGIENVSTHVRQMVEVSKNLDKWVTVMHVIEPNKKRDPSKRDRYSMPYTSCYFEKTAQEGKFLRESGYKRFPVLAPRWDAKNGDVYGQSCGMEALGDTKQLQHNELRSDQAIDYKVQPPIALPTSARGTEVDQLPGGVSFIDSLGPSGSRQMFESNLDLSHLDAKTARIERRINETFFADLFLMLAMSDPDRELTAREVAERHEEKLLMLGPVLERLNNELLMPLIDIAFDHALEAGILPPPPEELAGTELNVEFVSVLAQAQRASGIGAMDRLVMSMGTLQPFKADVFDKLDGDQYVDKLADMLGVDPQLVVADEKVAAQRAERAKAQAAKEQAALAEQAASAANKLAGAKTGEKNALTDLAPSGDFSGYSGPPGSDLPRPPGL